MTDRGNVREREEPMRAPGERRMFGIDPLRDIQWILLAVAGGLAIWALTIRSDAPFVSASFARELAASRPLPAVSTLARLPRTAIGLADSIDALHVGTHQLTIAGHARVVISVPRATPLTIDGWALDPAAHRPAAGVIALVDGRAVAETRVALIRLDVAAAYADPVYRASGFHLALEPVVLRHAHHISLLIVDAARTATMPVGVSVSIVPQRIGRSRMIDNSGPQLRIALGTGKAYERL